MKNLRAPQRAEIDFTKANKKGERKRLKFSGTTIARNRVKMTKAALAARKGDRPGHCSYWDSECAGLSIMVTEKGTMTLRTNFWIDGAARDRKLWRLGDAILDVEAKGILLGEPNGENLLANYDRQEEEWKFNRRVDLELERARKLVAEDRELARRGIDPRKLDEAERKIALETGRDPEELKAEKEAAGGGKTVKQIAAEYFADTRKGGGANLRSREELERKLKVDLEPWHDRPMAAITKADMRDLLRAKHAKSPIAANRLLSFIRRLWAWAASEDMIDADPASAIKPLADEVARDRFLSEDEIRLFWKACDNIPDPAGRIFKLLLVTGQRRGEVGGMRWSEISKINYRDTNNKPISAPAWLLPAARTKRREANLIPLTPLSLSLIGEKSKGEKRAHVFAPGKADAAPVGYKKWKANLNQEIGKLAALKAGEPYDPEMHNLLDWHLHDLRATFTSHLEAASVDRRVLSRILNHAEGDKSVTERYARYRFDREAAEALKLWSDEIARICGLNVISMRKA